MLVNLNEAVANSKQAHFARPLGQMLVSVDLGQTIDPTAIAVLEVMRRQDVHDAFWRHHAAGIATPEPPASWYVKGQLRHAQLAARINVPYLKRLPLRTSYPDVIAYVDTLLRRPQFAGRRASLLCDQTGVGRPVVDMFRRAGLAPIGVTITSGQAESHDPEHYQDWRVAKLLLVSRLQSALHENVLHVNKNQREAQALAGELNDFRGTFNESGYAKFGAREGAHDDLVLALAIGVWYATREGHSAMWGTIRI